MLYTNIYIQEIFWLCYVQLEILFKNFMLSGKCIHVSCLFQESRQNRVNSWKAFQAGSSGNTKSKNKKIRGSFKPPKHKAESR